MLVEETGGLMRPDGCKNPHIWVDEEEFDVYGDHYDAFEAGADEMLRCLRKSACINGQLVRNMTTTDVKWYDSVTCLKDGKWYFIEE